MDKKVKKKIDVLRPRIQHLRQLVAALKKQADDANELRTAEKQLADAEAELAKLMQ